MDRHRRRILMGAGGAACLAALPTPVRAERIATLGGRAFGSYWRLTLSSRTDPGPVRAAVQDAIAGVDRALSPFRADSEISRFNASQAGAWTPVSLAAARVIAEGLRIARLTGGAFDPTVGPVVARYGFGPISGAPAGSYEGIRTRGRAIGKMASTLTFDPCGIAKGYGLDGIAEVLAPRGIRSYLLELGGEVLARGRHPSGRPWRVAIERPEPGARTAHRIVRLEGQALATSGDWIQGYQLGNRRVSHIIDPRRREPVANEVASVSVIAPRAMTADALATGLMAMGPEKGLALAARLNLSVLYLLRDGTSLREAASPGFAPYVVA